MNTLLCKLLSCSSSFFIYAQIRSCVQACDVYIFDVCAWLYRKIVFDWFKTEIGIYFEALWLCIIWIWLYSAAVFDSLCILDIYCVRCRHSDRRVIRLSSHSNRQHICTHGHTNFISIVCFNILSKLRPIMVLLLNRWQNISFSWLNFAFRDREKSYIELDSNNCMRYLSSRLILILISSLFVIEFFSGDKNPSDFVVNI